MPEYEITESSLLPLHPFAQTHGSQRSSTSLSSCSTVSRDPFRQDTPSDNSRHNVHMFRLSVRNENLPLPQCTTAVSPPATPTPVSGSSNRQERKKPLQRSSWESGLASKPHMHNAPSPLSDPEALEDIDLSHPDDTSNYGPDSTLSSNTREDKLVAYSRHISDTSNDTAAAKSFTTSVDHPFKHGRPFRRWVGSVRPQGRPQALTIRQERWRLDEAEEKKTQRRHNTHRKSSSWSPFGFVSSARTSNDLPPSRTGSRLQNFARSHLSRRQRDSAVSSTTNSGSVKDVHDGYAIDQAALERASQRRKILEELLTSEESYVADLKVLLHVRNFMLSSFYPTH